MSCRDGTLCHAILCLPHRSHKCHIDHRAHTSAGRSDNDWFKDFNRVKKERIPAEAYREALTNAIIHRDYLIQGGVQVAMYDNRIEIISPGGLPNDMNEDLYFKGLTSISRNQVLSYVFYRLGIIERFGTGVKRIIEKYNEYGSKASFILKDNQIRIVLPVIDYDYSKMRIEVAIKEYLRAYPNSSRLEIEKEILVDRMKTIRTLNKLIEENLIEKQGDGPATTYNLK